MRIAKFALTMVFAVAGLVLLANQRAAADEGIPLKALAGDYSITIQGSYSICLNPLTFVGVNCATFSGPHVLPQTYLSLGEATRDVNGNSCATHTDVNTSLPVDNTPPIVQPGLPTVSKIIDYDPATATGEITFTTYASGKCNGATFDSGSATPTATATAHFAASNGGKRIDLIVTSLVGFVTDTTGNFFGDFSLSGTFLKQEN
jgi:hypothetical protein